MKIYWIKYWSFFRKLIPGLLTFCFVLIITSHGNAFGVMPKQVDVLPDELRMLPKWCQIRIRSHGAMRGYKGVYAKWERVPDSILRENKYWERVIGKDIYNYCHHYVWALNWINRYQRYRFANYPNAKRDRQFALKSALDEFAFMRGHLTPKHNIYYSMLLAEAFVYQEFGDYKKVVERYKEVMVRKPTYAIAYVKYARFLKSIGKIECAIKILQIGLKKTKGAIIKQEMTAMGGGKE